MQLRLDRRNVKYDLARRESARRAAIHDLMIGVMDGNDAHGGYRPRAAK